jgi:geranylgeranyl pyrophosphate synthase
MHTSSQKLRDEAISIMEKYGSIDYVKRLAESMVNQSWSEVEKLLPPSGARQKLVAFAEFLIERKV